jgi:3-oxoacyl-[acyl-carrier protein] reductase
MSDKYQGFVQSPIGKLLVNSLGLPNPVKLERYVEGAPLVDGTIALGGRGRLAESLNGLLDRLGISSTWAPADGGDAGAGGATYKGLVFDATGLTSSADSSRCATSSRRCCAASTPARGWSCSAPHPSR